MHSIVMTTSASGVIRHCFCHVWPARRKVGTVARYQSTNEAVPGTFHQDSCSICTARIQMCIQEALDLPATFKSVIFGNMDGCKATGGVNTYIPQRLVLNQANGVSILALWTNMILTSGRPRWADGTLFSEEQLALWDKSGENYEPTAPSPVAVSLLGANASSAPPPSMLGGGNAVDQCGTIAFGRCSNGQGLLAWQSRPCESDLGYICERKHFVLLCT